VYQVPRGGSALADAANANTPTTVIALFFMCKNSPIRFVCTLKTGLTMYGMLYLVNGYQDLMILAVFSSFLRHSLMSYLLIASKHQLRH
jgi:hypothetical protein